MGRALSEQEYIEKLNYWHEGIIVLQTKFEGLCKPLRIKCTICEYSWTIKYPVSLVKPYGNKQRPTSCPVCERNKVSSIEMDHYFYTVEDYQRLIKKFHEDKIKVIEFNGMKNTAIVHCNVCNHEWQVTPAGQIKKFGCRICAARNRRLYHKEFINKMIKVHGDFIEVVGKYTTSREDITVKCRECSIVWDARANQLLNGRGCPKRSLSKGEKVIAIYLDELGIEYISQYRQYDPERNKNYRYDFAIIDKSSNNVKLLIEFDGEQHFQAFDIFGGEAGLRKIQLNDRHKNELAAKHQISLYRIRCDADIINEVSKIIISKSIETI